jgi:phosphoglycolate phosphatase
MAGKSDGTRGGLVLFDIDGTIVRRAGPHHREALEEAVHRVAGIKTTTDGIPLQGMLDRKILETMMRNAGASASLVRRSMPGLVETAQKIYLKRCPPTLESKLCPGVRAALHRISRRGVPLGLVTGNLSHIGWKKMELAGVKRYFSFGAFAEEAHERAGLVKIAMRHARGQGWIGRGTKVWLVGDHQNDIRAAQANGIGSVAVATGISMKEELAACGPDLLLEDLRALKMGMLFG